MKALKVRKNFIFDKEMVEKVQSIVSKKHKNLTEAITLYFQALVKDPDLLDSVEQSAQKRTGNFIGLLDGQIGDEDAKWMQREHSEADKYR